jgi:hypothetical protein
MHFAPLPHSTKSDKKLNSRAIISSSDDEAEPPLITNPNSWQVIRSAKRKKLSNPNQTPSPVIPTTNRYDLLQQQPDTAPQEHESTPSIPKPPPIFIHGVQNYAEMVKRLQQIAKPQVIRHEKLS